MFSFILNATRKVKACMYVILYGEIQMKHFILCQYFQGTQKFKDKQSLDNKSSLNDINQINTFELYNQQYLIKKNKGILFLYNSTIELQKYYIFQIGGFIFKLFIIIQRLVKNQSMVTKLTLNKYYKKGGEIVIQFKSSNPNINFYKLHECTLTQFNEAINELRKIKENLPELPIQKIESGQYELDDYFKYLTKDVINDMSFQKFMNKCSSQRKKTQIQKMNGNFHQLPTILEGMQESASQKITTLTEDDDGLVRRQSSAFSRTTQINQSIKNSHILYEITKSELGQSKSLFRKAETNEIINENALENSIHIDVDQNDMSKESLFKDIDDSFENHKKGNDKNQNLNICLTEEEENCNIVTEIDEDQKVLKSQYFGSNTEKAHQTLATTRDNNSTPRSKIINSIGSPDSQNSNKQFIEQQQKIFQQSQMIQLQLQQQLQQKQKQNPQQDQTQAQQIQQMLNQIKQSNQQAISQNSVNSFAGIKSSTQNQKLINSNILNNNYNNKNNNNNPQTTFNKVQEMPIKTSRIQSLNIISPIQSINLAYQVPGNISNSIVGDYLNSNSLTQTQVPTNLYAGGSQFNLEASDSNATRVNQNFKYNSNAPSQTYISYNSRQQDFSSGNSGQASNPNEMSQTVIFKQQVQNQGNNQNKSLENIPSKEDIQMKFIKETISHSQIGKIGYVENQLTAEFAGFISRENISSDRKNRETAYFSQEQSQGQSLGQTMNYKQINQNQYQQNKQNEDDDNQASSQSGRAKSQIDQQALSTTMIYKNQPQFQNHQKTNNTDQDPFNINPSFSNLYKKINQNQLADSFLGGGQVTSQVLGFTGNFNNFYNNRPTQIEVLDTDKDEILDEQSQIQVYKNEFQPSMSGRKPNSKIQTPTSNTMSVVNSQKMLNSENKTSVFQTGHFKNIDPNQIYDSMANQYKQSLEYSENKANNLLLINSQRLQTFSESKVIEQASKKLSNQQLLSFSPKNKDYLPQSPKISIQTDFQPQMASLISPKQNYFQSSLQQSGSVTIVQNKRFDFEFNKHEDQTITNEKLQNKFNLNNQINNTSESQEIESKYPQITVIQNQSPRNAQSVNVIQQNINKKKQEFNNSKDEINDQPKGEKKKLHFPKDQSVSGFQSRKQKGGFFQAQFSGSSSSGKENQNGRKNDNNMYEPLSIRIDKSLLDPRQFNAFGASTIINNLNQLQVSDIQGLNLKNSVYVIGTGPVDDPPQKEKINKPFNPIKNSDWCIQFNQKENVEIKSSQENAQAENYRTILKRLCLKGDEKNQAMYEKVKGILEEQKFSDLDIIGRGSYGLVLKAKNPQGFERAIKVQLVNADDKDQYKDGEFKIGKYLTDDGTENLYGQIITLHNIYILQDTESEHRIYLMEMELAESSLSKQITKRLEKGVMVNPISNEEFGFICHWCIQSLVRFHNSGCVHRDIKPDNILKMGNNFIFTDFGESEYVYNLKNSHVKNTDTFKIKQKFAGTETYLSPSLRSSFFKLADDFDQVSHDPFKSDIYSLGLVFLQIKLFINGMNKTEIYQILKDPQRAYEEAKKNNINKIILKQQYFVWENQEYECINILQSMLEIEENKRMSTIKLALICQIDKQFLSRIIIPYPKIFGPRQIKEPYGNNILKVKYSIKYLEYEGETLKIGEKILRHGRGKLFRHEKNSKMIIYDGFWSHDLPHGQGKFSKIYQDDWEYEGEFHKGVFHGKGEIRFNGHTIYSGEFRNYILKDFLVLKQPFPSVGAFEFTNYAKKRFKLKKKADNQEICLQIKLHTIPNIENLLCILKESKANFQRLILKNFRKINMDSVSHAPNYEIYKKKDVFVKGKNKSVEVIYDEEFSFTDLQLENILQFCNEIEYIDLKFISSEQVETIFVNSKYNFQNLKQIKNANESKFNEEFFCNFINSQTTQRLEIIEYENKHLFGLALERIFQRSSLQFVKEINFSNSVISAQNDSFSRFFQSERLMQIQKLNLNSIESFDDESLRIISSSQYLLNLKELDISQNTKVTHKGLNQFSLPLQKNLPSLQILKLGGLINPSNDKGLNKYFFNPTTKMLESLTKSLQNLKVLDLSNSNMLTDKIVKHLTISKYLPDLITLLLYKCPLLTNKSFDYFHRQSNNLLKLEIVDFSHTKITLELKKASKFLKKFKIVGCLEVDWNRLARYLEISTTHEIHFDSDILEFSSKNKEEENIALATRLLTNKKIYLNIISDQSLETIIKFFEKKMNLDICVFSEFYPEYQLERYIVKLLKKQDKHIKFKVKDKHGVSFKDRIQEAKVKIQKYKKYQILENPLVVLDQDYDDSDNKQQPANQDKFEDLKRILNGRLFLEFHLLDLKNEQQFAHLIIKPLAQSKFTRGLETIDLSNSMINDDDLLELTKSQYFQKLEVICINNCQEITENGINCLIESIQGFPKLKEIQIQSKLVNFQNLNLQALQKRPSQLFKLLIDTLQISNNDIIQDDKMFLQYAQQLCNHNQHTMKALSLLGTPFLINKILNQLSQNDPSPLKYVTIDVSISSENDVHDIQSAISLIQNFREIESLFFDFRKLRFLSYPLMSNIFKYIENLTNLKQFKIMIKNYGKSDQFLEGQHIIEMFENFKKFTQLKKLSVFIKGQKNVNQAITKIMTDKIGACMRGLVKNLQELNIQFIKQILYFFFSLKYSNIIYPLKYQAGICFKEYRILIQSNLGLLKQVDSCHHLLLILESKQLNFDINSSYFMITQSKKSMLKTNRDYIKNDTIKNLMETLKSMVFLRQLSLNLKNWGKKNEYVTHQSLFYISDFLQSNKFLKLLDINLKNWDQSSIESISEFFKAINSQTKLQTLMLNLAKWGVFNSSLVGDIIEKILEKNGEQIQHLKINFSKSYKLHQKNVSDSNLINLFKNLSKMNELSSLHLNLSNWGQNNELITDDCIEGFNQILSKKKIKSLTIKIKNWGCENQSITEKFVPNLVSSIQNLNDLEYLYLNFAGMGQFISDNKIGNQSSVKQIGETLIKLKKVKTIKLNMNDWKTDTAEDCIPEIFKSLDKKTQVQEINISLSGWFKNNQTIKHSTQTESISAVKSIKKMTFNFSNWCNISQSIQAYNLYCNTSQLERIQQLTLNFSKWTKLNDNFELEIINFFQSLQELNNLKLLNLDLSHDRTQDVDLSRNIKNQIEQCLTKLIQLESLKLNFKGWKFRDQDIQNEVIEHIFLGISRLIKLRILNINMDDWNQNYSDFSKANFEIFNKNLKDLKILSKLSLSFENWYQQSTKSSNMVTSNNTKSVNDEQTAIQYGFMVEKISDLINNAKQLDYFYLNLTNWPYISKSLLQYLEGFLTKLNVQHKLLGKLFNNNTILSL